MTDYERVGENLIVFLPKELDHHTSVQLKEDTDMCLKEAAASRLILSFEKTEFMDSAGIGVILYRYKKMKEKGGEVALYGASPRIQRLLKISGIGRIIRTYDTKDQALR